jgi:hypothetical protein
VNTLQAPIVQAAAGEAGAGAGAAGSGARKLHSFANAANTPPADAAAGSAAVPTRQPTRLRR